MTKPYTTVECTVCRPKFGAVWIVIDAGSGTRSEQLQLAHIHPDDVETMEEADKVQPMKLRVLADVAAELGIEAAPKVAPAEEPTPVPVPAFGDLFAGIEPVRSIG
jgi:hypothetical protein